MKMQTTLRTILAGALLCAGAMAADRPAKRQVAQQARIEEGKASGELTKGEAAKVQAKKAKLHREIVRDRKDGGGLTAKERVKIEAKQDKLSREIAKEKRDAQTRK